MTAQDLIDFENWTKKEWEGGNLPCLLHLCGGNEQQLLELWQEIKPGDWIFSTHRNHYHALLAGIPPDKVKEFIWHGQSMFVYSEEYSFCCSAVLGGCCGMAAGVARAIKNGGDAKCDAYVMNLGSERARFIQHPSNGEATVQSAASPHVWCFIGDGGEEQGKFYSAALSVEANDLPCTFIIEDNDRSVDTPLSARRGNAKGLEHLFKCVRRYQYRPTYPHAGSGCNFKIEFKTEAIERLRYQ